MIPAGYLLKRTAPPEGWTGPPQVIDVCSVSDCVNDTVVDLIAHWAYNGFGLATSPDVLHELASASGIDLTGTRLFYYEIHEQEMETDGFTVPRGDWRPVSHGVPADETGLPVLPPQKAECLGYDVVASETFLEHSPLSCNSVADSLPVNQHCLFATLDAARSAIETGAFKDCEPGTYKIVSVYLVDRTSESAPPSNSDPS